MPRDLADVLHHLIPEVAAGAAPGASATCDPAARPLLALPIGDHDAVRAAFAWNLAVEMQRLGAAASLVAPATDRGAGLWPDEDARPLGVELEWVPAGSLGELYAAAQRVAARTSPAGAPPTGSGGVVLVRVPPRWVVEAGPGGELLRWTLLLSSPEPDELLESYGLAKHVTRRAPGARVGVTVHGVHRRGEAGRAFSRLAETASRRLGLALASYGLLVDDLQVYRAVVAQRPIGLVHPQGPAARSLGDVAQLLLSDAGTPIDG